MESQQAGLIYTTQAGIYIDNPTQTLRRHNERGQPDGWVSFRYGWYEGIDLRVGGYTRRYS